MDIKGESNGSNIQCTGDEVGWEVGGNERKEKEKEKMDKLRNGKGRERGWGPERREM
jgi:hypothetical protein